MNSLIKIQLKIPKLITLYLLKNNLLVIAGSNGIKALKMQINVLISKKYSSLFLLSTNKEVPYSILYKKTIIGLIEHVVKNYKKAIYLVGTGYRAFLSKNGNDVVIHLKLGYSHIFFIKIPKSITIVIPKPTKLFLIGTHKKEIMELVAFIRSLKVPDSYKGKGFFLEFEKVNLKEGKKV